MLWMSAGTAWGVPVLLAAQTAVETKVVRVRVSDVRTLAAIPGVELYQRTGEPLARTDSSGTLRLRIAVTAPFTGQLQRVGYVPSSIHITGREPGDSVVVLLAPVSAQALGTVEVRTSLAVTRFSDFDRRRLSGNPGIFLTDSQIVKGGHIRLTDLFRRFPSIKIIDSAGTYLVTSARAQKPVMRPGFSDLAPCVFQVVVDDVQMPWGFDMDLLNRDDIHGMEIYPGPATIPVEYRSTRPDAMCGLIAIWTKSR